MAQPVTQIAPKPFTFDALTKVHTQLLTILESRKPQVPRTRTVPTYQAAIEVRTIVPGLEPKRALLSPIKEVVSYETYRLDDKRQEMYESEGAEIHRLKKRQCGLLSTLQPFNGKNPIAFLTFCLSYEKVWAHLKSQMPQPYVCSCFCSTRTLSRSTIPLR